MDLLFILKDLPTRAYGSLSLDKVDINLAEVVEALANDADLLESFDALVAYLPWAAAIWGRLVLNTSKVSLAIPPISQMIDRVYKYHSEASLLMRLPAADPTWAGILTREFIEKLQQPNHTIAQLQESATYRAHGLAMANILDPLSNIPTMLANRNFAWFLENFELMCNDLEASDLLWRDWDFCLHLLQERCVELDAVIFYHIARIHQRRLSANKRETYAIWWEKMRQAIPDHPDMVARMMFITAADCESESEPEEEIEVEAPAEPSAAPIDFVGNILAGPDDQRVSEVQWRRQYSAGVQISMNDWIRVLEYAKKNQCEVTNRRFSMLWLHTLRTATQTRYGVTTSFLAARNLLSEITKRATSYITSDIDWYPPLKTIYKSALRRKLRNNAIKIDAFRALF